jgi:hypothetical protein
MKSHGLLICRPLFQSYLPQNILNAPALGTFTQPDKEISRSAVILVAL